jgi:ketosteroid isomerase-like protein
VVEVTTPEPRVPRRPYLRWLPLVALGLFALLPPPSLTVIPDAPAIPAAHIEALERELMLAIQARDRRRLDDLIAADCNLTGSESGGERAGKRAYLAAALDPGQLTVEDYRFVDMAATVVAADVAIVRGTLDRQGWLRGHKTAGRLLFTDVWKRRAGRWQLVNRHTSAVPADHPRVVTDRD